MKKAMMKKGGRRKEAEEDNKEVQMCFLIPEELLRKRREVSIFARPDYYRLKIKKKDLPGWCPFGSEKCPFGLACRFSGSTRGRFRAGRRGLCTIALFEALANPRTI